VGPRLLARRVDALVVAFQVECSADVADELVERQALADLAGRAELRVADLSFAMKRSRKVHVFPFENADVRAVFDEKASGGWNLEVVVRATFLAAHSLEESIALARYVADDFGTVEGSRLRRVDLCADFASFPLARNDVERMATTRAHADSFMATRKDVDEAGGELCQVGLREHRDQRLEVTGITVAAGNPVMARVYDKSAELLLPGREQKRAIEHAIWRNGGWDGSEQVTRVEFQHRGEFLDEIHLRDVDALVEQLDALWQRDVRWLRMVEPESATRRKRCKLDLRWLPVAEMIFRHPAEPIQRSRTPRGGAPPAQVLGAVLSRLGATGRLHRCELGITADGEVLDETGFAEILTPSEAESWLGREVRCRMLAAGEDVVVALLCRYGPRDAVRVLATKINANVARFASIDDLRRAVPEPRRAANG
jgi:hypothetical protein